MESGIMGVKLMHDSGRTMMPVMQIRPAPAGGAVAVRMTASGPKSGYGHYISPCPLEGRKQVQITLLRKIPILLHLS
jgi:hypothetical protein